MCSNFDKYNIVTFKRCHTIKLYINAILTWGNDSQVPLMYASYFRDHMIAINDKSKWATGPMIYDNLYHFYVLRCAKMCFDQI